ncbi:MAG: hypothetical protein ABI702_16875 [Burkholderiales bacterium]
MGLLTSIILLGCSTNPSIQQGASIQDFASSLNGKRFSFEMTGSLWVPAMSGVLVTAQRIPKGLLAALAPAGEHCVRQAGEIAMTKMQAVELHPQFHPQLPRRALCERRGEPLWALDLQYGGLSMVAGEGAGGAKNLLYLNMTTGAQYLSSERLAERLQDEQLQARAVAQAAAARQAHELALEQERQRLARDKELDAARTAAQWPARVAAFRANLKAGDRFKWTSPPSGAWGGPFVGVVVRVDTAITLVQFDNLTIGGQQTRYILRDQLEPFDGPVPAGRFEIK